jgi:hypothetical protein
MRFMRYPFVTCQNTCYAFRSELRGIHTHTVAVSFAIVCLGARAEKETMHSLLDGNEDIPYGGV